MRGREDGWGEGGRVEGGREDGWEEGGRVEGRRKKVRGGREKVGGRRKGLLTLWSGLLELSNRDDWDPMLWLSLLYHCIA